MSDLEARVRVLEEAVLAVARIEEFGDKPGHPFRGNQHSGAGGGGGGGSKTDKNEDDVKAFPQAPADRKYGMSPSHRTREYISGGRVMGGEMRGNAAAVLPTGSSVNLVKGKGDFIDNVNSGTTHVVDVGRPQPRGSYKGGEYQKAAEVEYRPNLRAVTTSGNPVWNVGDQVFMNHDQNPGRSLVPAGNYQPENGNYGSARVVGTLHTDGRSEGNVPNKSMPHWVFK